MDRIKRVLYITAAFVFFTAIIGCNTAAKINIPKFYFEKVQFIGGNLISKNGDSFKRVCSLDDLADGQQIDGIAIDFIMLSTDRSTKKTGETTDEYDKDNSIQVGDKINRHHVKEEDFNPSNVELTLNCIKKGEIENYSETENQCGPNDISNPQGTLWKIVYQKFADRNKVYGNGTGPGNGFIVLVDQSGSTAGFVDPLKENGYIELTYNEANHKITEAQKTNPNIINELASDPNDHRIYKLRDFIDLFNSNDNLLVFSYNEDNPFKLICRVPGLEDPKPEDCWGRKDFIRAGIDAMQGDEGGRTPLWEAVYKAYQLMMEKADVATKHILVVSDGPDTCYPTSEHFATKSSCSSIGYDDVLQLIKSNQANDIHIHFIQYQAKGYPKRDPLQMEISCITDGSYQFINSNDMNKGDEFGNAMKKALKRTRYSVLGKWRLLIESAPIKLNQDMPLGTKAGYIYRLFGNIKMKTTNPIIIKEDIFSFAIGNQYQDDMSTQTPNWDNSIEFRKECTSNAECGGNDENPCVVYCMWESKVCDDDGFIKPQFAPCGDGGQCCNGVCCVGGCDEQTGECKAQNQ